MNAVVLSAVFLLHFLAFSRQQEVSVEDTKTPFDKKFDESTEKCLKQFHITEWPDEDDEVPKNLLCFFKCVHVKAGVMDEFGKFMNVDATKEFMQPFNESEAMKIIEKCNKQTGDNACETAYKVTYCVDEIFKKNEGEESDS